MTGSDLPQAYFRKAVRALDDAKALLAGNRTEGACSRAYYAMFSAARAALLVLDAPDTVAKTHTGLIRAFGQHIVLSGHLDQKFGRSLNDIERLRQTADYIGDPPSMADATDAVGQAAAFLDAVRAKFIAGPSGQVDS